jgi:hypothetical protein
MSAEPTNGQSNIDVILKAMAPDRREAFLRSRNRLKQFNENDEILALAHYLDTVVVMVDGLTKNVAAAMTAHTEPMANLTAQLKRVAAELPSHANTLTPKTIRRWLACWAASILLVVPAAFFWGWISAQREQSNRLAATLAGSADRPLGSDPRWVGDVPSNKRRKGESFPHTGYPPSRIATHRRWNQRRRRWVYEFARLKSLCTLSKSN